jgi:hypothetical protein
MVLWGIAPHMTEERLPGATIPRRRDGTQNCARTTEAGVALVPAHLGFERRTTALAHLGGLLALANLARLFIETPLPHFGEYTVFLNDFFESLQDTLERLSFIHDYLRHSVPPPLV